MTTVRNFCLNFRTKHPRERRGAASSSKTRQTCSQRIAKQAPPTGVKPSGESRIIFLPERSSICQYRPKLSAINIKKQSRARLLLAHPVLYILKVQKAYGTF